MRSKWSGRLTSTNSSYRPRAGGRRPIKTAVTLANKYAKRQPYAQIEPYYYAVGHRFPCRIILHSAPLAS